MKMRIKGQSLRLRISRPEMTRLIEDGRIEETIRFGGGDDAVLRYALSHRESAEDICLEYRERAVMVILSSTAASRWAKGNEVGIYGEAATGEGSLALLVEKDFACLDGDDPHDPDAFPNPSVGEAC